MLPALEDPQLAAAATIPVERIQGVVLLISAGDERTWPCQLLSDIAHDRLEAHAHPFDCLHHPAAGHLIMIPPFTPTAESLEAGPGVTLHLGRTPAATARPPAKPPWTQTLDFLQRHLDA